MSKLSRFIATLFTGRALYTPRAPRLEIELGAQIQPRLLLSISLPAEQTGTWQPPHPPKLIGSTLNVSETGLAIVVPSLRIQDSHIDKEDCRLLVMLDIYPAGVVEMETEVVHWREFKEKETDVRYLVGVRITKMSHDDRARYMEYLDGLTQKD